MKSKRKGKKHIVKPLSLWALNPEETLEVVTKVDPAKVCRLMRRLRNTGVRGRALSNG